MLVIVAVEAEKFPVAAVGRVVVVVMVLVMHRQFAEFFPFKFPGATATDMREEFQGFLPIAGLALLFFLAHLRDELVMFCHHLFLSLGLFDQVCRL